MYFNGALGSEEPGPRKDGKAEINSRGIEQVDFAVEFEATLGGKLAAALQKLMKDGLMQVGRLFFIHLGEAGP